jgi:hypothetical protein
MSYLDNKLPLETVMNRLPEDRQAALNSLLGHLKSMRLTPRWYATDSFNVKYKGRIVFRFKVSINGDWGINFTVANVSDLDEALSPLSKPMLDFYFKNLRFCRHCNPTHGDGRIVTILGHPYGVCAEPEIYLSNPSQEEVEMLKSFVEIRKANILKYKS